MYTDVSIGDFPKTLMIRNHEGGMVWQVYHVKNLEEVEWLSGNARKNGFLGSTLENYQSENEETWHDWREKSGLTPLNYFDGDET